MPEDSTQPHRGQPVASAGPPLGQGSTAVILVHGRGAGPENILELIPRIGRSDLSCLAPAAANRTWYPFSFMAEHEKNEPGLSSALSVLRELVDQVIESGVSPERLIFMGFSQGACLTAEFVARHARRYGGVLVFSGGLIGPPGTTWDYPAALAGTPVFLGCSDVDGHVPKDRVEESAREFERLGAAVTKRLYPGMGHLINEDEIEFARSLVATVAGPAVHN
jgi:predicted esterase